MNHTFVGSRAQAQSGARPCPAGRGNRERSRASRFLPGPGVGSPSASGAGSSSLERYPFDLYGLSAARVDLDDDPLELWMELRRLEPLGHAAEEFANHDLGFDG